MLFIVANVLPTSLAVYGWRVALKLNPHHVPAALNRVRILQERKDANSWDAFQDSLRVIQNPQHTSASDLALTWVPGQLTRRIARRVLWGNAPQDYLTEINDRWRQDTLIDVARYEFETNLAQKNWERASEALDIWSRTAGETLQVQWARVELLWQQQKIQDALKIAAPLVEQGNFISPLDALAWAERLLGINFKDADSLVEKCLEWARAWTPERAALWTLKAQAALANGEAGQAEKFFERAMQLEPENLEIFLAQQGLSSLHKASSVKLQVNAPESLEIGTKVKIECVLEPANAAWIVHALPPNGWGIVAEPRNQRPDAEGKCTFTLRACRPDRVRGDAWILTFVAIANDEYATARVKIHVPDRTPGRLLVLVTEDHELWEERGTITRDAVERLLVTKSKFASEHFSPWTHMVEVGSTLALLDWAAEQDAAWQETREAVRAHLVAELTAGNDMQPHLHAFNLPNSPDFPYRLTTEGISPCNEFLLTAEERRRDFARAYAPHERIQAVAHAVAQLERIAEQGDSNYHAVLWRSGQLEFGDAAAERAWSSVALLRAGIFADSDLRTTTQTAFLADIAEPFTPQRGGDLLQLPIANNLEGNFFKDARALAQEAKRTSETLRAQPGIHLVTLLTHDKFINARRGGDEFRLDSQYNDWETIRKHLDAWREAGAERVTAREGIKQLLDDGTWHLRAWLTDAKWSNDKSCVQYVIELLGKGITVSREYPQSVRVIIPPFLRDRVRNIRVVQDETILPIEQNTPHDFWSKLTSRTPEIHCEFQLEIGD